MMKKTAVLLALCFCALFISTFSGCMIQNNIPQPTEGMQETANTKYTAAVRDYFPIMGNTRYVYQGEGNEFASYDVYNVYTSENRVQQRIDNGGTVVTKVIAITDGKLIQTFSNAEIYYRENYLEKTNSEEVLLMEPLEKGTSWTLEDGSTRTITNASLTVSTPLSDYDAIEVTTEGTDSTLTQYYAKGVGLVKSVYRSGDSEVSSTLSSIETDVPLTQTIRLFYPGADGNAVYYQDREVDFYTNDSTGDILAKAYKEVPAGALKVFSPNTAVNHLTLSDDGIVYLDLSGAFLTEMNAGAGYESLILASVANTFGNYYQTDCVILTIDGKLYESGHIAFSEGEYLQADFTGITELQP